MKRFSLLISLAVIGLFSASGKPAYADALDLSNDVFAQQYVQALQNASPALTGSLGCPTCAGPVNTLQGALSPGNLVPVNPNQTSGNSSFSASSQSSPAPASMSASAPTPCPPSPDGSIYCFLVPLTGTPTIDFGSPTALTAYLQQLFAVMISIGGVILILSIIYAGFQYIWAGTTIFGISNVGGVAAAKERLTNAAVGIAIVLGAYLIVNVVNPDILRKGFVIGPIDVSGGGVQYAPIVGSTNFSSGNSLSLGTPGLNNGASLGSSLTTPDPFTVSTLGNTDTGIASQNVTYDSKTGLTTVSRSANGSTIVLNENSGDSITPTLTAYAPNGSKMEGGYTSAVNGPDGTNNIRTLDDYLSGRSSYVTLAGSKDQLNSSFIIPSIQYTDAYGQSHTLNNVPGYVQDTGCDFNPPGCPNLTGRTISEPAGTTHYDVAIGFNYPAKIVNSQPFTKEGSTSLIPAIIKK